MLKKMVEQIMRISRKIMRKILQHLLKLFWLIPIKNNRVVFRSSQGTKYNCNPKYISEYLNKEYKKNFEIIWLFKNTNNYKYLKNDNVKICKDKSIRSLYYILTAKFIIDNHGIQSYMPIREKQEVINTWHGGGAYKKPLAQPKKNEIKYLNQMYKTTTKFLSSCERFSTHNLKEIYLYTPEKIIASGSPRNDIFFREDIEIKKKVKKELGIKQKYKIVLYAPTYRELGNEGYYINVNNIISACQKKFGGEFVFGIRFHRFREEEAKHELGKYVFNTNQYEDMQELIYASDVIITDYSSLIWDASLVYKPCFIYATDLLMYLEERNFYTPIKEWPFPLAENMEQLINNIESFNEEEYRKNVDQHHKDLGSYENGTACQQVAEYMLTNL